MSGKVAALDSERVVAHTQDGDAQGKDQEILRAQAKEPCMEKGELVLRGAVRAGPFSGSWRSGPKQPSPHPWEPRPKRAQS